MTQIPRAPVPDFLKTRQPKQFSNEKYRLAVGLTIDKLDELYQRQSFSPALVQLLAADIAETATKNNSIVDAPTSVAVINALRNLNESVQSTNALAKKAPQVHRIVVHFCALGAIALRRNAPLTHKAMDIIFEARPLTVNLWSAIKYAEQTLSAAIARPRQAIPSRYRTGVKDVFGNELLRERLAIYLNLELLNPFVEKQLRNNMDSNLSSTALITTSDDEDDVSQMDGPNVSESQAERSEKKPKRVRESLLDKLAPPQSAPTSDLPAESRQSNSPALPDDAQASSAEPIPADDALPGEQLEQQLPPPKVEQAAEEQPPPPQDQPVEQADSSSPPARPEQPPPPPSPPPQQDDQQPPNEAPRQEQAAAPVDAPPVIIEEPSVD